MMRGTMRALVKTERAPGLTLQEVDIPSVGPHDALVKVAATSICGTDFHIYSWDEWSQGRIKPPMIAGHEFAGEVIEVGDEVKVVAPGDMVSAETHIVCHVCPQCKTGQLHTCINTSIIGVDVDGCFAEYVSIPAENLWINDPDLDPAVASAQEPLGNAVHTALDGPVAAARIAVTGCGPIGLMSIPVLKKCGAQLVIATEVNEYRLNLARELGADIVINPAEEDPVSIALEATDGLGVDGVLEMSGSPQAINQGLKMLRPGGRMSVLGVPPGREVSVDMANDIVFAGVSVRGIAGRKMWETWYQVSGLLAAGLDIEPIITHRLPLEEFEQGMELMASGNSGKVVLIP